MFMIVLSVGLCISALYATKTANFSSLSIRHTISNRQKKLFFNNTQHFYKFHKFVNRYPKEDVLTVMTCIPKFHLFLLNASNIFMRLKLPKSASATTLTGKLRMQPHLAYLTSHISARNKVKTTSHACSCLILMTTYSPYIYHVPLS